MLAGPNKSDWNSGNMLDRQQRTTARIAVKLSHDHSVQFQGFMKCLGTDHGVLTGHPIDNQKDLVRLHLPVDRPELFHQFLVDRQPAGSVQDHNLSMIVPRFLDRVAAYFDGIRFAGFSVKRYADLFPNNPQLLDCRGSL